MTDREQALEKARQVLVAGRACYLVVGKLERLRGRIEESRRRPMP